MMDRDNITMEFEAMYKTFYPYYTIILEENNIEFNRLHMGPYDITQDIFIVLWEFRDKLDPRDPISNMNLLTRIAVDYLSYLQKENEKS